MKGLLAAFVLCLTACQSDRPSGPLALPEDVNLRQGTQLVVINYLFAQGMAESYAMSGRATPADLLGLIRYDHAALNAIHRQETSPDWKSLAQASAAVRDLMDYTSLVGIPGAPAVDEARLNREKGFTR